MNTRFAIGLAAAALLTSGAVSLAQTGPIVVQFGATTLDFPDNAPISFNVGTVSSDLVVKIYDIATLNSTNAPSRHIPAVTISGTVGNGSPRLNVLIGDGDEGFPTQPNDQMGRGAIDFAGLTIGSDSLRNITRAAIAISGDITGTIDVGHIFRLQALGRGTGTGYTGGRILADVIARAADGSSVTQSATGNLASIEFLHAGDLISGNILAGWDPTLSPAAAAEEGSIAAIRVGVEDNNDGGSPAEPTAEGITGEVRADLASIGSIYTSGAIGTPSVAAKKIWAGNGINEIRVVKVNSSGDASDVLDRDIKADIQANRSYTPGSGPLEDATIAIIRTSGDITGTIKAGNIAPLPGPSVHYGIITEGAITADIEIEWNQQNCDIIGSTITGNVRIGLGAKGSIVATDDENGEITSVWIGYGVDPTNAYPPETYVRGFIGNNCIVSNPTDLANWYTTSGCDGGTIDSVIRARSIGELKLNSMTLRWLGLFFKNLAPRVESPEIGTLIIGDMREGVVWSGELDDLADGSGDNDPSNDYASITNLEVGCVGPAADLWFKDCPFAIVHNNMVGELHLPSLESSESVWIGKRLGDGPGIGLTNGDLCACDEESGQICYFLTSAFSEASPRQTGYASIGAIRIASPTGLSGQVIVRRSVGDDTDAQSWSGQVIVGDGSTSPAPVVLSPDSDSPDKGPYYKRVSTELGDGAVGLAPFFLYESDCVPQHDRSESTVGIFEGDVNNSSTPAPIRVRFYGPIKLGEGETSWSDVLTVHCRPFGANACNWTDVTSAWVRSGPSSTATDALARRTITLTRASGYHIAPGVYLLQPVYEEAVVGRDLMVDKHAEWPTVCVGSAEVPGYVFIVYGDCDDDETPDHLDSDLSTCATNCTVADFNQDGAVTVQDIFDFLSSYFANCGSTSNPAPACGRSADVNNSGSISVQDIFDFLGAYFGAHNCG